MHRPVKLSGSLIAGWIPTRKPETHKGDYGHILIVAGSRGMSGASVLAALGALRGGAGLVTVATPASQQPIAAKKIRPEAMTLALPESSKGTISPTAIPLLLDFIARRRIRSLALGPGLSQSPETIRFVRKFLVSLNRAASGIQGIVLDADGFLAISDEKMECAFLRQSQIPLIVTPHPGEMAIFCGVKISQVQQNRIEFAEKFAKLNRVICLLKGHKTIVTDGEKTFVNTTGNPGMATGGSGDVLTGLIAALVSQQIHPLQAAASSVYLHGLAGDLAKKERTEIALIAGDIAEKISWAFKTIYRAGHLY